MKKYEIEKNPEQVGKKQKKVLIDKIDERLKDNSLCKGCKK